jgi:hypothetical protein
VIVLTNPDMSQPRSKRFEWQILFFRLNGIDHCRSQRSSRNMIDRDESLISFPLLSESPRTHSRNMCLFVLEKSLNLSCQSSALGRRERENETTKTALADSTLSYLILDYHTDNVKGLLHSISDDYINLSILPSWSFYHQLIKDEHTHQPVCTNTQRLQ